SHRAGPNLRQPNACGQAARSEADDSKCQDQALRDHGLIELCAWYSGLCQRRLKFLQSTKCQVLRSPASSLLYCQAVDERYSRQILFNGIGEEGQRRLLAARVLIVGCGALGSAHSESLARAGVGHLRIVDRDFVEPSNLQRQTLFTESDAEKRLPKAIAAANHLHEINSQIEVEPHILDVNHSTIEQLIKDCDVVIDGTDNFATRYLINDVCVKHNTNWIYGA